LVETSIMTSSLKKIHDVCENEDEFWWIEELGKFKVNFLLIMRNNSEEL
jgi:hypothetical protein